MSDPITPTQDHKDTRILAGSMSNITYAHPDCFYCQGWANEAKTEANRHLDAEAAQVGDDHHWARYYKNPTTGHQEKTK